MTLSFVLLVVSGLMIKSVVGAATIKFPFDTDVLMARVSLDERSYPTDPQVRQMIDRVRDRVAAVPAIRKVGVSTDPPDGGGTWPVTIEGDPPVDDARRPRTRRIEISPEFFDVLKVPVLQGRSLTSADREGGAFVAIVSADFAKKYFPKGDAIGRRIQIGSNSDRPWRTIVGIVPKLSVMSQLEDTTETVFLPLAQGNSRDLYFFAARSDSTADVALPVRRAVAALDPNLAVFSVSSLQAQFDQRAWPYRVFGSLFMTFGLAALVMAAAGLYGVMSFGVRRRTQEIGVRMALGAGRRNIIRMVLRQGLWQVAIGVVVGVGLGGLLGSSMRLLLFQVGAWDPQVFGATIVVLSSTGIVASLVPALRAAAVDPLKALRHE
jgi:putative ABC transport system permease protein